MARVYKRTPIGERFERHFMPEPNSGCWLWTGGYNNDGYGHFNDRAGSPQFLAHRYSWMHHRGPIPVGLQVLHKCDLPACVNPDHLFLGTRDDNMADMTAKGRASPGEKCGTAKLREADVRAIRADRRKIREIAAAYGVTESSVSMIQNGKRWKHLN